MYSLARNPSNAESTCASVSRHPLLGKCNESMLHRRQREKEGTETPVNIPRFFFFVAQSKTTASRLKKYFLNIFSFQTISISIAFTEPFSSLQNIIKSRAKFRRSIYVKSIEQREKIFPTEAAQRGNKKNFSLLVNSIKCR